MTMSIKNINSDSKPHFVLVPFMAQGHMIPMVDIARLLADRGVHISFITTPVNATRVKPVIENGRSKNQNQSIDIIELNFPCKEFGLPDGCENADLITSVEHYKPFFKAASALKGQLKAYIQNAKPRATCIVSDYCNPFTAEVGQSLDVPRIIFHGPSCMFIHSIYSMSKHNSYDGKGEHDMIVVPDLPKKVEVTKAQAPNWFTGDEDWEKLRNQAAEAEASAVGIVMNTFYELEAEIIDRYEKSIGKRVWPIGPLCLYNKDTDSKANRGKKSSVDGARVLNWLDSHYNKNVCKWFWIGKRISFLVFIACIISIVACSITKKDALLGIAQFLYLICAGEVAVHTAFYYAYKMWDHKDTMLKELETGKPMSFEESFVAWHTKREKAKEKGKAKRALASTCEFVDNKSRKVYMLALHFHPSLARSSV